MSHKVLLSVTTLAVAAAAASVACWKMWKDKKEEKQEKDDEIHFIKIEDAEDETPKTYSAEGKSTEVQEIAAVYPYLDPSFIETILAKDKEFNATYEEDVLVTVTHVVKFSDAEERKAFVEIMEVSGYTTELDGEIVKASRKFFTESGAIISDILNVANQTNALMGEYVEYSIH